MILFGYLLIALIVAALLFYAVVAFLPIPPGVSRIVEQVAVLAELLSWKAG